MHLTKILLILGTLLVSSMTHADWIEKSNTYALQVLEAYAPFTPESIAVQGMSQYDRDIFDLGPRLNERLNATDRATQKMLQQALKRETHPEIKRDLNILIQTAEDSLASRKIESAHMLPYFDLHLQLFQSFRSILDPRVDIERYPAALVRLEKYIGKTKGFEPVTTLAAERTAERFAEEDLVGPYVVELEKALAATDLYVEGIRELLTQAKLTDWEEDFAVLEQQLAEYKTWLTEHLLPRARQTSQLPPAVYADNLRNYGVRSTPSELIETAQADYQFIRSEMKALARRVAISRGWEDKGLVPVILKLKSEQIPADQVLSVYKARLVEIEKIIEREQLVTLPERDASIRLATEAESAAVPAPFMSPPQLINNTGQYGEFVLVSRNPTLGDDAFADDWSHDAITWALTVHEARPGHELQFASLVENEVSLARALFAFNSANVEGWGLYAEALMHEFMPEEAQLFNLFTRMMRAARMFLDPMVNTGQLTPEQVKTFLVEQTGLSLAMATSEADRYAFRAPGQATAYYYGYLNLMRLRSEVEIQVGNDFDQKAFHDFVLAQGLLPPALLREAVLGEFVQTGAPD